MPLYAAHAPQGAPTLAAADRVALVPQGFSWPAFFFGPWWLLAKGLWCALLGWFALSALMGAAYALIGAPYPALAAAQLMVALFLGLEGARLRSNALARAGRPLADLVAAPDDQVALKTFFERWSEEAPPPPSAPREPAPDASGPRPSGGGANSLRQPVLGLFPEPGGRDRGGRS